MKLDSSKILFLGVAGLTFAANALGFLRQDILVRKEVDAAVENYIQEKESIVFTQEETEPN